MPETYDPLSDLLRACARLPELAQLDQVRHHADRSPRPPWQGFPAAAEAHGLVPLARLHLKQAGVTPPIDVQQQLFGLATQHQAANAERFLLLGEILDAFDAASIRVIALKGAALAHLLYPTPGLRPLSDLDLLVDPSQAAQAQAVLGAMGFDAKSQPTDRRFVGHHHLPPALLLRNGQLLQVEIHTDALTADTPGSLQLDRCYDRRQRFDVGGRTAYAFGHADMLQHLARHAAERASLFRLIWVADIVGYATRFRTEIDWPDLRRRYPYVINALSLLHQVTPLPAELLDVVPAPRLRLAGAGTAFRPLKEIVQSHRPALDVVHELFVPDEWWVRFYYGARSTSSCLWYRWFVHPTRVVWWFARRGIAWVRWKTQ